MNDELSGVGGLLARISLVVDPRKERGRRHHLVDVLFIALVAILAGADDAEAIEDFGETHEDWLRQFLLLPHGIPSQDTYLRVFALLSPQALRTVFLEWVAGLRSALTGGHIAFDGKTVRGSFDKASGAKAIHMVSAWHSEEGLVLGQLRVNEKANEIVAIPELLALLDLRGATVTADAMGCQRAIAKQIIDQDGRYVLSVKDNHPTLHEQIREFFDEASPGQRPLDNPAPEVEVHEETDAGHGRVEVRRTRVSRDLSWIDQRTDWAGLVGIAEVRRERIDKRTGAMSVERAFYIVGRPPQDDATADAREVTARAISEAVRRHWGIENQVHWVLDVSFGEDANRTRVGHAAENFSIVRHLALNLLRGAPGKKRSIVKRRQRCGWDQKFLLSVLAGHEVS